MNFRLLFSLLIGASLLVPVGAPAPISAGVDGGWIDNANCIGTGFKTVWGTGDSSETQCLDDGFVEGGDPVAYTPSPACVPGSGAFVRPRYVNTKGEQKIRGGDGTGTIIDRSIVRSYLLQAEARVWAAIKASGNQQSFYWRAAYPELIALELQISPTSVRKGDSFGNEIAWRHVQTRLVSNAGDLTERTKYFADITKNATALKATDINLNGYYGTGWVTLDNPRATQAYLFPSIENRGVAPDSWPTLSRIGSVAGLERTIAGAFGLNTTDAVVNTYIRRNFFGESLAEAYGPRFSNPLRSAYENDTWMRNGNGDLLPFIVYSRSQEQNILGGWTVLDTTTFPVIDTGEPMPYGPMRRIDSASEFSSLLAGEADHIKIQVAALIPNRITPFYDFNTGNLEDALWSIINRNLYISRGTQNSLDIFDGVGAKKYYIYPAFTAPNMPAAANLCGATSYQVTDPTGNPMTIAPLRDFAFDDSYAGCKTKAANSLESWRSNVRGSAAAAGDSCWIDWMIWPIPEPQFNWDLSLLQNMHAVTYTPTAIGSVGNPVTLTARRNGGYVVYRDTATGTLTPIERNTDKTLEANLSVGFALEPSVFNFTQVGVSAEVGIPGLYGQGLPYGQVLSRISRQTDPGSEYNIPLTFERTALEQLQRTNCKTFTATDLMRRCGIGYDPDGPNNDGKGEWFYRVHLRTWYGGAFYAPEANFEFPEVRGLFYNDTSSFTAETDFKPGVPGSYPDYVSQVRNYSWPSGASSAYQSWSMAFPGVSGPRITATGKTWDEMRTKAAGVPAYTYSNGSRYPILDVSGPGDYCFEKDSAGRCAWASYVDVYVRSRQPILDR